MSYKHIKWMILIIPTITVGLWEYIRHQFLMPYLSMEAGNWLTPVIVYLVSVTLLSKLFQVMERAQAELEKEKAAKSALEAREQMARELHDGIAQSLFLLSVQMDKADRNLSGSAHQSELQDARKTVHEIHHYVRQAIAQLKVAPHSGDLPTHPQQILQQIEDLTYSSRMESHISWTIPDEDLSTKEQIALIACIREAVLNIRKHANADSIQISGQGNAVSWKVSICDDGIGYEEDPWERADRYGLRITKDRAAEMGWDFDFHNQSNGGTCMTIEKGGHHL
ncbi:histidine kinase [Paenibacillus sp. Marseille-Q4541]|uniref:sensor histidine kinase n=1 Tax=Paenibacillus sp. Marseille-Q4541 TaxID=2831522 RepID=UPI001BA9D760|nr:histidine kinase [Paenibacillus sp. Marseille-Q4541]